MENYNYKVVAELREDLSEEERERALKLIEKWQKKFEVAKIDDTTYCKAGTVTGLDDFGPVTFFYSMMKRFKQYFSKLEYYDFDTEEKFVAV